MVPEAWQVAVGVCCPSKPERSGFPIQVRAPGAAHISGSPCTALFVPKHLRYSSLQVQTVGALDPGAQRIIIIMAIMLVIVNMYQPFICQALCKGLCMSNSFLLGTAL